LQDTYGDYIDELKLYSKYIIYSFIPQYSTIFLLFL